MSKKTGVCHWCGEDIVDGGEEAGAPPGTKAQTRLEGDLIWILKELLTTPDLNLENLDPRTARAMGKARMILNEATRAA